MSGIELRQTSEHLQSASEDNLTYYCWETHNPFLATPPHWYSGIFN